MSSEVSHGRGGAGNISVDETKYVDGSIVRSGPEGSRGDGAYSAGRGGAGNIGDVGTPSLERKDADTIPDEATRAAETEEHHAGRGGAGNALHKKTESKSEGKSTSPIGLADRLKAKIFGKKASQ